MPRKTVDWMLAGDLIEPLVAEEYQISEHRAPTPGTPPSTADQLDGLHTTACVHPVSNGGNKTPTSTTWPSKDCSDDGQQDALGAAYLQRHSQRHIDLHDALDEKHDHDRLPWYKRDAIAIREMLLSSWLNLLLVCSPLGVISHQLGWGAVPTFLLVSHVLCALNQP